MNENFEDVEVGDRLILHTRTGTRVVKVARLTAKQLVTDKPECKFWKKDGREVGGNIWSQYHVTRGTVDEMIEILDRNRRHGKANKVRSLATTVNLSLLNEHDLDMILEALEKCREDKQ